MDSSQLAEFFIHLFEERGLAPITIKGYRSAIARVYRMTGRFDPGKDQYLSFLMDNFSLERPRVQCLFPKWSLEIVLNFLKSSIFEPLDQVDHHRVLQKTVFLISLATAARVSEIHALSASKDCLRWNLDGSVSVLTAPGFISKNRLPEMGNQSFNLKPLNNDRNLCPVRALKEYCKQTEDIREPSDHLFLSGKKNKKTSPQFISNIVKSVIKEAYSQCSQDDDQDQELEFSKSQESSDSDSLADIAVLLGTANKACANTDNSDGTRGQAVTVKDGSCSLANRKMVKDGSHTFARAAHELRAVASSLAFHRGASLSDVIQAVGWTSATTFGRFYLRHMGEENVGEENMNIRLPA